MTVISFLPILKMLFKALKNLLSKNSSLNIFIFLSIFFTIYNSFFGYPREDANQALVCYLGIGIWFSTYSNNHKYFVTNQSC